MLTETGKVVAIDDDGLWVETLKKSLCARCSAKAGCGQGLMNQFSLKSDMSYIKALFTRNSKMVSWSEGDTVLMGIQESALLKGAFLAYGLPIVCMFIGIFLVHYGASDSVAIIQKDFAVMIGALIGLVVGGVFASMIGKKEAFKKCYQASVLERQQSLYEENPDIIQVKTADDSIL